MSVDRDDARLVFMPLDNILLAGGHCDVIRDHWWSYCPDRGLLFWQSDARRKGQLRGASPQANRSEGTALMLQQKLFPWAELRFVPLVLQSINVGDYA